MSLIIIGCRKSSSFTTSPQLVFPWKVASLVVAKSLPRCMSTRATTTDVTTSTKRNEPTLEKDRPTILSTGLVSVIQDRKRLIGCNIYITAGGNHHHVPLLTEVVQRAQTLFKEKSSQKQVKELPPKTLMEISEEEMERSLIEIDKDDRYDLGVLVHAYTDKVYNRTSLHLAGTPEIILDVARDLIQHVVVELRELVNTHGSLINSSTEHPHVGLVDHVAVVPLVTGMESRIVDPYTTFTQLFINTHGADVARKLGMFMCEKLNVNVFYYGLAHKKNLSLFKVRKRRTNFFKSHGKIVTGSMEPEQPTMESCTVGAPDEFVENYNVRMKNTCSKKTAQYLSRLVRESDGGLKGVEAIAFPYTKDRWEVACNLLRPYAGGASVNDLKNEFREWNTKKNVMEKGYRVGTTQEQSIKVLETISRSEKSRNAHDEKVMTAFQEYLEMEE